MAVKPITSHSAWILIPLVLSSFTHLWNPTGFPTFFIDEGGYYLPRALHFMETGNPKDDFPIYDHPYFGWIFLGSVLGAVGYPDSLNPTDEPQSIERLYLYPRLLMGILSVFDTFILFKIADRRYGRTVALIAAILFAVMPLTWITRRILLDAVQLPFFLTSILFAIYASCPKKKIPERIVDSNRKDPITTERINGEQPTRNIKNNRILLYCFVSGIFMGLAIFTKLPIIMMAPLVCFLLVAATNHERRLIKVKSLLLWLGPVVLIPLVWPAHALLMGDFETWKSSLIFHLERDDQPLSLSLGTIMEIDPALVLLGFGGAIYGTLRKDFLALLWVAPFLAFLWLIGYVSFFHLIPIYPLLCISTAFMATDLANRLRSATVRKVAPIAFIAVIGVFGLASTTLLITQNLTSSFFQLYSAILSTIPDTKSPIGSSDYSAGEITLIANIQYHWIPKYVLDRDHFYQSYYSLNPIRTEKVVLVEDRQFRDLLEAAQENNAHWNTRRMNILHENSYEIGSFVEEAQFDRRTYPYSGMAQIGGIGTVDIRSSSSNSTSADELQDAR